MNGLVAAKMWGPAGLFAQASSLPLTHGLQALGLPVVNISSAQQRLPGVRVDDEAVGRAAAEHLLTKGCRRFAVISEHGYFSLRRSQGFCDGLSAAGITSPTQVIGLSEVARRAKAWQKDGPIGIFAVTITVGWRAAGICSAICPIPSVARLIVAGDDDLFCACIDPPLSAIPLSGAACATKAVALMRRLLAGGAVPTTSILVPPGAVVARRSTDASPATHPRVAAALVWIEQRLARPIGISIIARGTGCARRTLEADFRRDLGTSIHRFLQARRLDRATELLTTTDLPVRTIAGLAGYGTAEHLGTLLLRRRGETPGRMRSRLRDGARLNLRPRGAEHERTKTGHHPRATRPGFQSTDHRPQRAFTQRAIRKRHGNQDARASPD